MGLILRLPAEGERLRLRRVPLQRKAVQVRVPNAVAAHPTLRRLLRKPASGKGLRLPVVPISEVIVLLMAIPLSEILPMGIRLPRRAVPRRHLLDLKVFHPELLLPGPALHLQIRAK